MAGSLSLNLPWELARTAWGTALNAMLGNPLQSSAVLSNIAVKTGANVINHGLGRALRGYFVTLNSAAVTFYDSQASNQRQALTLVLNASGPAVISLIVF